MNFVPTEKAILAINAYDVDEERGVRDIIYLHDMTSGSERQPIYRPGSSTLYYLSGANQTWSTSSFEIDPSKLNLLELDNIRSEPVNIRKQLLGVLGSSRPALRMVRA